MTITPVVPRHLDQYIDTSQGIIIDFTNLPVSIYVKINSGANTLVWDNISGFQAGWTGNYIIDVPGKYRLVLDVPSGYTPGDSVKVIASDSTEAIDYKFRIGLERLTTESDLISPQVVYANSYIWTGRVHNSESSWPVNFDGPGNVYLQVVDPRSSEVIIVPGEDVGMVYDPTLNKVFIYFNHHGTVWYMEANPNDIPDTKNQIRSIRETVNFGAIGSGKELTNDANDGGLGTETFPPLKRSILENNNLPAFGSGENCNHTDVVFMPLKKSILEYVSFASSGSGFNCNITNSPYNAAPTPNLASGMLTDTVVKIRVSRPTATLENLLLIGYYLVRFDSGTPSIIGYQAFSSGSYVEFQDLVPTAYTYYAVLPVYYKNLYSTEQLISIYGGMVRQEPNSIAEAMNFSPSGSGLSLRWTDTSFTPIGP